MSNISLTESEKNMLLAAGRFGSKNEDLWADTCDQIKAVREGQYPSEWFSLVILGLLFTEDDETTNKQVIELKSQNRTTK